MDGVPVSVALGCGGPDARWDDEPAGAGWTVIGQTDRLKRDLEPFLG